MILKGLRREGIIAPLELRLTGVNYKRHNGNYIITSAGDEFLGTLHKGVLFSKDLSSVKP